MTEPAEKTAVPAEARSRFEPDPFEDSVYDEAASSGTENIHLDLSHTEEGYIAVSVVEDARIKLMVIKDDQIYTYNVDNDGTPAFFPLQSGDGTYLFRVMKNIVDSKYAELYREEAQVKLIDEFQPFIRPSDYVSYTEKSECVQKAKEMADAAKDESDFIASVYTFICDTVKYDDEKAENIQSGYMPVPDETMETGMGICFDYASLAASMMRSQGIPTKVIFGYVSPNDIYHAWNMFYTEKTGWVTVELKADGKTWTRLDLTFSANGANNRFIGNGDNYADVYEY